MSLHNWLASMVLGMCGIISCGPQEPGAGGDASPLAQVGTELITAREFADFVAGLPEWTKSKEQGSAQVRDYLQTMTDRTFILKEARAQGLEQRFEVRKNLETALSLKLGQEVEQRQIHPRVSVSEAEMKRAFAERNWGRLLKIAHIVVSTRERAEEALAALRAGRPFEVVAYEFSENRASAAHGGEKPYYYSRLNATLAVRDSLFSLQKGKLSGILPIPKGYEIFKVLDERQASFSEMGPSVYKELIRERLREVHQAYIDSLAEQFQWTPVPENLSLLMGILRSGKQEGEKKVFYLSDAASETVLYRYEGGQVTLGEAVARSQFIRQGRFVDDSLKVAHYLERDVVMPQLLLLQAYELGLDQDPDIQAWLEQKQEEVLILEMRQLATASMKPVTEQDIRAYYEGHKSTYRTSSMAEVVEIQVEEQARAEELLRQIRADLEQAGSLIAQLGRIGQKLEDGGSTEEEVEALRTLGDDLAVFTWLGQRLANPIEVAKFFEEVARAPSPEDLAEAYILRQLAITQSVRHGALEAEGVYHLYWYETPRFGPLVKEAMEAETGALIGPLEHNALYSIAKVMGRQESGIRPFEEVKRGIKITLRQNRENEEFDRWLKELRASSDDEVIFFDENIEKLGRELQEEASREQPAPQEEG